MAIILDAKMAKSHILCHVDLISIEWHETPDITETTASYNMQTTTNIIVNPPFTWDLIHASLLFYFCVRVIVLVLFCFLF